MQFQLYRNKDKPVFLYIHAECLSATSFKEEVKELKKDFTVVLADINGHGSAAAEPFTTIDACCTEILHFLDEQCNGHVQVLSGLSLGGQIAVELLAKRPDICTYAMIESAMMQPVTLKNWSAYASEFMNPLAKQKWFNKFMYYTVFNDDFAFADYHKSFCAMSKETIHHVYQATYHYHMNPDVAKAQCEMAILVGQREKRAMKQSADLLHNAVTNSQTFMLMNYTHGDFSLGNPREYIRFVKSWVQKKDAQQRKQVKKKKTEMEGDYMPNWKHLINKMKTKKATKQNS